MATDPLARLFRPKAIAVVGGDWAKNVIDQCDRMGFAGQVWPVNPARESMGGRACFGHIKDLPTAPDAVFLAVNRSRVIESVEQLRDMGAGGVVCFASGFAEAGDAQAARLQAQLTAAAGTMPLVGPNCYGFVNAVDQVPLWPDVHGLTPVSRGVAIISQSSNIAINLTMQQRGLPIAFALTLGNGACVSLADVIIFAANQPEVSAIGLYVEGFGDARAFHNACAVAKAAGKAIVALKAGASDSAQTMAMSHTASLAGGDDIAGAFLEQRCGVGRVRSLEGLLESLKLLHYVGPLSAPTVAALSCSGGEASAIADTAHGTAVTFPAFNPDVIAQIKTHCHPLVQVSNPFDYHTFDWGNQGALTTIYSAAMGGRQALNALILDWPKPGTGDDTGWMIALKAWAASQQATKAKAVVLASLPENMPATVLDTLTAMGLVPMQGFGAFIEAVQAAAITARAMGPCPWPAVQADGAVILLNEHEAKTLLTRQAPGLFCPASRLVATVAEAEAAAAILDPVVLKACGDIAHKSDIGGVVIDPPNVAQAFTHLQGLTQEGLVLVEAMAPACVAELLVGVHRDPVLGLCLSFGMGGVMTELWQDSLSLPLPVNAKEIVEAFAGLKVGRVLNGYRGGKPADINACLDAIDAVVAFAHRHQSHLVELDINPLMVHEQGRGATAVDAVVRMVQGYDDGN